MANKTYEQTPRPKVPRSSFDLSYNVNIAAEMGLLYPVQFDLVMPGDVWQQAVSTIIRAQPLVAPIYHDIRVYFHTWYVRIPLLDENFEEFFSGGPDGDNDYTVPVWDPTDNTADSLWDIMGFPVGVDPDGFRPAIYPLNAYNAIYNFAYRDQNLIEEVDLDDEDIKRRAWMKDRFTTMLPSQQRGTSVSFPLSGYADFTGAVGYTGTGLYHTVKVDDSDEFLSGGNTGVADAELLAALNKNTLSNVDTFDMNDFRFAASVQIIMEQLQRSGARYPEAIQSMFGITPDDLTLGQPKYLGGYWSPIIVHEVLQTGQTDTTPQGNLAGMGITRDNGGICKYRVPDWGIVMTLMSIMPDPVYEQGVDRQWIMESRYDLPLPALNNLAEQPIYQGEIYAEATETANKTILGYQGHLDHHRIKHSRNVGMMRDEFDYWTLSRQFSSAPTLSQEFIECNPRKDCFAVVDEPPFIVTVGNIIKATRPMQAIATPGLTRI